MITPKLSFEPRERTAFQGKNAYFNPSFFRGELRRSWPKTLCYALLLFLILPLPLLFEVNSHHTWSVEKILNAVSRDLTQNIFFYTLAAMAIAVFAGMLSTRYLCRRTSVDFYHSLPIRREGLLIGSYLCGVIHFTVALTVNALISLVVLLTAVNTFSAFALIAGKLLLAAGYMLLTYLLFYTLTVFCGLLCGTSSMQVMMTGLLLGAFPLFRLLYLAFCDMVTGTVDVSFFMDGNWSWTSPLIRLFYLSGTDTRYPVDGSTVYTLDQPLLWWEIALWLLAIAAFFLGALGLYRLRHVERAGTPVVFGPVAVAVKWIVMVLATMAVGWLFAEIGGGVFWLFFGFALGGFLSFLLINTILTKNPKQMFDGWRVMLVYLVAFCIVSVGLGFAASAIEDIMPKKIDRISIRFDQDNYNVPYYTDPAVIAAWQELWAMEIEEDDAFFDEEFVYYDEKTAASEVVDPTSRTFRFDPREIRISASIQVGPFVIPYNSRSFVREDAEGLLRAMAESAEFEAGWDGMMKELAKIPLANQDETWYEEITSVTMLDLMEWVYWDQHPGVVAQYGTAILGVESPTPITNAVIGQVIADQGEDIGFDFFQSPVYAYAETAGVAREYDPHLNSDLNPNFPRNVWYAHHIFLNMPSLYREVTGLSEAELLGAMADQVLKVHGGVYVVKNMKSKMTPDDEGVMLVTDREQIVEILRGLSLLDTSYASNLSPFTVLDEGYGVSFPNSSSGRVIYFIKGKVPAFITAALG